MSKYAIFVALSEEMTYAIDEMERHGSFAAPPKLEMPRGSTKFHYNLKRYQGNDYRIEVSLIKGMGNIISAAHVGTAFQKGGQLAPDIALLVGISGSLDAGSVGLGHVIVSNFVKYYSPDKIHHLDGRDVVRIDATLREKHISTGARRTHPVGPLDDKIAVDDRDLVYGDNAIRFLRDQIYHPDPDNTGALFVKDANEHKEKLPYPLKLGTLLGSSWVVDSETYTSYLKQKNDWVDFDYYFLNDPDGFKERCRWDDEPPLAVDMESYGFFKAVAQFSKLETNVRAYAIRGISDLCADKTALDKNTKNNNRKVATENAIKTALLMIQYHIQKGTYSYDF